MTHNDSADSITLSFTDVLTCVFGAAIFLFLLFVVLAVLVPSESGEAGKVKGISARQLRSIQAEINTGFATSTLRLVTSSEKMLKAMDLSGLEKFEPDVIPVALTYKNKQYWGVQYEFTNTLQKFSIRLKDAADENKLGSHPVYATLAVGGTYLCTRIQVDADEVAVSGTRDLFVFDPNLDFFLRTDFSSQPCI